MIPDIGPVPVKDDPIANMTADLMGLADTHRWTVIKTVRHQSVAEHSFNVAVLVMELVARLSIDNDTEYDALRWALIHDLPETLTGDVDGKFKRDNLLVRSAIVEAELRAFPHYMESATAVSTEVNALVKLADKIEAIMFIRKWGVGARAEAVAIELETGLRFWTDAVGAAYQKSGMDDVYAIAVGMIARDRDETHTVQTRAVAGRESAGV